MTVDGNVAVVTGGGNGIARTSCREHSQGESETYHVRDEVAEMLGVALSDTKESSSLSP